MKVRVDTRTASFVLDMSANGLGVVRTLGRKGIPIVGVDSKKDAPGLKSRYCRPLVTPHPAEHPQAALRLLLMEGAKRSEKSVLYPTSDEWVLFVSRFRRELEREFLYAIPSEDVVESIIDKRKQYKLAQQIGTPYPKTCYPENVTDVERIKDELVYPVFVKPYYSHIWAEKFGNKGFKVSSPSDLVAKYEAIFDAGLEAMVQAIILGPDSNVVEVYAYLSDKYEPLAWLVSRKLRQHPNNFGVSTNSESIHDQEALEIAMNFFRLIEYRGIGHIELKKDERDGKYKMIELNARSGPCNVETVLAGVDFPLIQFMDLTGRTVGEQKDYKDGVKWLNALPHCLSLYESTHDLKLSMMKSLEAVRKADCHAYFASDDMWPFIKQYQNQVVRLGEYFNKRHVSLAQ